MYYDLKEDYENKNPNCGKKAKKVRKKCEKMEASLKLRTTSLTGVKLHSAKEDDGDEVIRRDQVVEGGSAVNVGLVSGEEDSGGGGGEIEVVKTKKRNRRKLCKKKEVEKNSGADDVDAAIIDDSIDGHTKRKERMFGLMETFLMNQTSKNSIDHERPYKDLDLEVLQEKIEKQEEKKSQGNKPDYQKMC